MPRRTVVDPRFGARMRALRDERGLSLRALERHTMSSRSKLQKIETGQTPPDTETAALIDAALNAGGDLKALVKEIQSSALTPESPWLTRLELRRQRLHDAVSVGAASAASLDDWDRTVWRHGRATRYRPASQMLNELDSDFAELQRALAGRHTSSALRQLTRVTAQLAGLVFLTLIKLNQPISARAWARTARVAAEEAGEPEICSWVWAQEAYVHFYEGNLSEAVHVARRAQALAGNTSSAGVPLAAALEGRAWAMLGRRREADAALGRAESGLARLDDDAQVPSAFSYNEAQLRFHEGNALTYLEDSKAAWTAQRRALRLYPTDDFLDRTLVQLDRASCLIHDGDTAAAAAHAIAALVDLTPAQRAGLITLRAQAILTSLPRQQRALPAVREFSELLASTPDERHSP